MLGGGWGVFIFTRLNQYTSLYVFVEIEHGRNAF